MILLGAFKSTVLDSPTLVALATVGVILAAVYLLYMVYETFFGELTDEANAAMPDVNAREFGLMAPLIVLMLVLGFFPNPFLKQTAPATDFLLDTIETKRAAVLEQEAPPSHAAAPQRIQIAPPDTPAIEMEPQTLPSSPTNDR
jgi:NADH-quinone oxidoreductase subunit M